MFFKNVIPLRYESLPQDLEELLAKVRFVPCGPSDRQTRGFIPPRNDNGPLVETIGPFKLLSLATEVKVLPSDAVERKTEERCAAAAEQQGYVVGRKQRREIKERVIDELLPTALTKRRATRIIINTETKWLFINAATHTKSDEALEMLGRAGALVEMSRPLTVVSPTSAMTNWLAGGDAPAGFTIDKDCELRSCVEEKATVRYIRQSLDGDDVRQHIAAGKLPTRLAMTWNDRLSFILTDRLELKRLEFLDIVKEQAEQTAENADEQFDADVALMGGELSRFVPAVMLALGGLAPIGEEADHG